MGNLDFFSQMQLALQEREIGELIAFNPKTVRFGLQLTAEEAKELVLYRNESLKKHQRLEVGSGILLKLVEAFCDSSYLQQDSYLETLSELSDIFYLFKNESGDKLSDDELITFMREQFDEVCCGDTQYLADTCLERFTRAVRAGYEGYYATGGQGEYEQFSQEQRWDKELYLEVLRDLAWS